MRRRNRAIEMKITLPAVVEQAKRGIAALLDLGDHQPGADGMDGAGGNRNDVTRGH